MLPQNLSSSLEALNLGGTNLFGELSEAIFQLPNLRTLQLSLNNLTGNLLKNFINNNTISTLSYLDLSINDFFGDLPESIGNLKHLYHMDLSQCNFSGSIPESIGNLTQITHLDLHFNNFTGQFPSLGNLEQLIDLDLSFNKIEGQLPEVFSNFRNLTDLNLSFNLFNGYFPSSILNLTKLILLDLSSNSLIGPLPMHNNIASRLINLDSLSLNDNSINGTIPFWLFTLPSLTQIDMGDNQLTGQLYEFQYQSSLQQLYLTSNNLNGPIPKSISNLVNLSALDLSYNNFSGNLEVSIFSTLQQLSYLDISFNSLSLVDSLEKSTLPPLESLWLSSCGVRNLDFLTGISGLQYLDLSNNMLQGRIFTTHKESSYIWGEDLVYLNLSYNSLTHIDQFSFPSLQYLDLRSNFLRGPLHMPSTVMNYYFASDNKFTGKIPSSVCNNSYLTLLDLSNNNLSGAFLHV
ncbi:OLC1v1021185C2 [Oldenlandia corymbosa var. corymbosa]|nr:OLC1v1021185C2 [Oldenlandia corymbosa var. corymbosa]